MADIKATPQQCIFVTIPLDGTTWGTLRHFVELCSGLDDEAEVEFDYDPDDYNIRGLTATLDPSEV